MKIKRSPFCFIFLFWSTLVVAEPSKEEAFVFTFSKSNPKVGEKVYYRLSFTNNGNEIIRVPKDLLSHVLFSTEACLYFKNCINSAMVRGGSISNPSAADIDWIRLQPGSSIESHGLLRSLLGRDCEKTGCKMGSYGIHVRFKYPPVDDLQSDQFIPKKWEKTLGIEFRPYVIPVNSSDAFRVTINKAKLQSENVKLDVTIQSNFPFPIWVPKDFIDDPTFTCFFKKSKTARDENDVVGGIGSHSYYQLTDVKKIQPNSSINLQLKCDSQGRGKQFVTLVIQSYHWNFFPEKEIQAPHYFTGILESNIVSIKHLK